VFGPPLRARLDRRVARVLEAMRAGELLDADVGALAAAAGISPSRFMHVFRHETGMPLRRFRSWARLNRATAMVRAGASWTEAAHAAGFASSAHLSETCRAIFGVKPSVIGAMEIA